MHWEKEYSRNERLWGEQPSELATAAVEYLRQHSGEGSPLNILDIGCGYGRDASHYAKNLECTVHGIDASKKAIEMASGAITQENVRFELKDFNDVCDEKYEVVTVSNLYQLLKKDERRGLRQAIERVLKLNGILFLSTLSINDPEHAGKGTPVSEEPNSFSFPEKLYLHFCTGEELAEDFASLEIDDLYEHEYDEPRATGETHHHISWILIARNVKDSGSS